MAGQHFSGQRLTRDPQHAMLGGVCAGFANRYAFDVTLLRIVMVLLTVATGGIGALVYLAAWIVMPRDDAPLAASSSTAAPEGLSQELRDASDRLAAAARVLAGKTREAAEEISEIARRAPTASAPPPPAPDAPPTPPPATPPAPPTPPAP